MFDKSIWDKPLQGKGQNYTNFTKINYLLVFKILIIISYYIFFFIWQSEAFINSRSKFGNMFSEN